ncbi:MAG: translation elongation factor 4, partial [Patescibacteria group bacterium]
MQDIRNFCIIAHIDHGKSTLADRFLELTHTVAARDMKDQMLDQMELERERGITIKLQPVRMEYEGYTLNLIDTPGHVDFSYEVSRSLQAVEGAILLVDASQGVEAQTLANLYLAMEQNLVIIPVINKIDLPAADVPKVVQELVKLLGVREDEILLASGKTGQGVKELLDAVIERVPPPSSKSDKTQALIFDSLYDDYRGVVAYARIVNGAVRKGDVIHLVSSGRDTHALEVGTFKPQFVQKPELTAGEIGYIVTGFKEVGHARVGDTVTQAKDKAEALPGYKEVKPMVFAGIFPEAGDEYPKLRDAMEEINLQDAALQFEQEQSKALGFGYRCGFLGMLHMEILAER